MAATEILDDIISHMSPEQIPVEYIMMAKVTDYEGVEHILAGAQLRAFMKNPRNFTEVRVVLNVGKLRQKILSDVTAIYEEVDKSATRRLS